MAEPTPVSMFLVNHSGATLSFLAEGRTFEMRTGQGRWLAPSGEGEDPIFVDPGLFPPPIGVMERRKDLMSQVTEMATLMVGHVERLGAEDPIVVDFKGFHRVELSTFEPLLDRASDLGHELIIRAVE